MNTKLVMAAIAMAAAGASVPSAAQVNGNYPQQYQQPYQQQYGNNIAWQGAPDGLQQRIDWLQQRIQRGQADRTLDPQEARRAQVQLNTLRRDADLLQRRLDQLSSGLRWARAGNNGYNNGYNNGNAYNTGYNDGRDPYSTDYDASRYYRSDSQYTERRLSSADEVYRGSDGRYYCKRSDGSIGLVIGGVGGALLGNVIDGGRNRTAGTLIGGALGALLGQQYAQANTDVRCR